MSGVDHQLVGLATLAQAFGRSRGGITSKVHARCDNQGLPVGFILTGGEASGYAAAVDLKALPLPKPKTLLANKGYDGDRFRQNLLRRGNLPIIPPRSNRKVPIHPDYRRYKGGNRIERMFGKLKQQRRIATRYDKTVLFRELPQPRRCAPMVEVFCQHGLGAGDGFHPEVRGEIGDRPP